MSLAPRVPDVVGIVCPDHPGFQELRTRCRFCGFDPLFRRTDLLPSDAASSAQLIGPEVSSSFQFQAQHDECELLGDVYKAA